MSSTWKNVCMTITCNGCDVIEITGGEGKERERAFIVCTTSRC